MMNIAIQKNGLSKSHCYIYTTSGGGDDNNNNDNYDILSIEHQMASMSQIDVEAYKKPTAYLSDFKSNAK
jgi:hypothetical protein